MNNPFALFLDRVVGRLATLVVGIVSSRFEALQAALQADQQSSLEDLARQYEADGKLQLAATLRERAARLTSTDLASEAVEILGCLSDDGATEPSPDTALPSSGPLALGELPVSKPAKNRRKKADAGRDSGDTGASK